MTDLTHGRLAGPSLPDAVASPVHASRFSPTLLDIFAATVLTRSDQVALDAPEVTLTYAELDAVVRGVADRLRAGGVGPGDRVGVRVPSGTADLYVAILGVLCAGAAYVPVDADDPAARAAQIFADAKVCAVLHGDLQLDWRGPAGGREGRPSADDDAWIIFTSGSTGTPKGVAVTHRSAAAFIDAEADLWHVAPEDRVLAGLSVGFDASCEEMWLAWAHGAALVPAPRRLVRSGVELGPWLAERRITVISTVPTLAAIWDETALHEVRLLILGGEACPEPLAWRLASGREVWNTYGPTEATVVSTAARLAPGAPVTIGFPLRGWDVAVVDADGAPVAPGVAGELMIGGVGLGRYLDPERDRERFAPSPALGWDRAYRTGDIVRETEQGLAFVGRRDHQVKIGGRRIELGEIDAQLTAVPGVRAACTVVRETASGNRLLVGYVAGNASADEIRDTLAERMPASLHPLIVTLDELPVAGSGKVNRAALPWPPPAGASGDPASCAEQPLSETARWLAERWREELGPVPISADSDFFVLGGTSLAAAKLASTLRTRYPAVAVADVYNHRRLGALAVRLEQIAGSTAAVAATPAGSRRVWGAVQLAGVLALLMMTAPQWLIGILAFDRLMPGRVGPQVGWGWLIGAWLVFVSPLGRAMIVAGSRRLLLADLRPGRYPRNGWLSCRLWFVERLADGFRADSFAGTPWAARVARLTGHRVGAGARLGTLPPTTGLVTIGAGATLEGDLDLHGWVIEGNELVIGEITIGDDARIGGRCLLMPGAQVGHGAEVDAGSVVTGIVTAGERWGGSPAERIGTAAERWPAHDPEPAARARLWSAMFAAGLVLTNVLALVAAIPGLALILLLESGNWDTPAAALRLVLLAPAVAATFLAGEALIVALGVRLVSRLITPGMQPAIGATGWALWFTDALMDASRSALFSLYATVYTRPWLRLAGITVGRRTEVSTAAGLNRLSGFGATSFATDDVAFMHGRSRGGWLYVAPITVGDRSFLGNGAILEAGTTVGEESLIGLLTTAPTQTGPGTSWLGSPALELPRRRRDENPSLTTRPSQRRIMARGATELFRILFPATVSVVLASLVFYALDAVAQLSLGLMVVAAPIALLAAGLAGCAVTVAAKWLFMGRYSAGEHPLWSFFVWRDEIINSCQEQLAGPMLLNLALGTPVMGLYLRAMGARVGRDVWCETLNITEFDMVSIADGAVVNRYSVIETHLFHDRVMQIGTGRLGPGATLGPYSTMLPDTEIGDGCVVGGRSIVMRGERLPSGTRWHGAPVVAA
ncbi:MAG: Pls/PosA family non-ribosomal peptide synthetase [Solirubrobacteraceae bacterium]